MTRFELTADRFPLPLNGEFIMVIKTIRKFSDVIGYQQLDLSINWTVAHVMLVIELYAPFCARCCGALCIGN